MKGKERRKKVRESLIFIFFLGNIYSGHHKGHDEGDE